jgi:hypothetical protein
VGLNLVRDFFLIDYVLIIEALLMILHYTPSNVHKPRRLEFLIQTLFRVSALYGLYFTME